MEKTVIKYSAVLKNPRRASAKWYGRIRQDGRERFTPLYTQDPVEAQKWVKRMENVLFQVNEYEEAGRRVPDELLTRLVTVDKKVFADRAMDVELDAPNSLVEKWEADLVARGFRRSSIDKYVRVPGALLGEGARVSSLTVEEVKEAFRKLGRLSDSTRKFYGNALRSFFMFLGRLDLYKAVPRVKVDETADKVFWTEEDMLEICLTVTCGGAARTLQYRDYFSVLAACGCRNSELMAICWKDLTDATIRFPASATKLRKSRTVPIPFDLYAQLDARRGEPDQKVFDLVSPNPSARYNVLQRTLKKLGLKGGLHTFRRSRSALLYRKVGDIKVCAALLGDSPQVALRHYQDEVGVEQIRKAVFFE